MDTDFDQLPNFSSAASDEEWPQPSGGGFMMPTLDGTKNSAAAVSSSTECTPPKLLHPLVWLYCVLVAALSLTAILCNCFTFVVAYYSRPMTFAQRRAFAIIPLNYAFLAALSLAKKLLWIFSSHRPCAINTVLCKLQEFPTVFVYLYGAFLPLILALNVTSPFKHLSSPRSQRRHSSPQLLPQQQLFHPSRPSLNNVLRVSPSSSSKFLFSSSSPLASRSRKRWWPTDWPNACSTGQICLVVLCVGLALVFTALDDVDNGPSAAFSAAAKFRASKNATFPGGGFRNSVSSTSSTEAAVALSMGNQLRRPKNNNNNIFHRDRRDKTQTTQTNCSIVLSIRRHLAFALLTLLLALHTASAIIWKLIGRDQGGRTGKKGTLLEGRGGTRRPVVRFKDEWTINQRHDLLDYLRSTFRDILLIESSFWLIALLATGVALVQQYVLFRPCTVCTRTVAELCFGFVPVLVALVHPFLTLWLLAPVRRTAQRFCPFLYSILPAPEPVTPPLPIAAARVVNLPTPTVRILVTTHD